MTELTIRIERFNPDAGDTKTHLQTYTIAREDIVGEMLLNALEALKEKQDATLSFRRSCREGVCGSDGMNINGVNGLACTTSLSSLGNKITLRALPGFPIVRDLVVDMTNFYQQYDKVKPYLQNNDPETITERLQSPEERAELDGLYECILCACCTSSCPSYWWNPDKYIGPAGLLTAYRFVADSRDTETKQRLEALKDPFSVFRCRTIMNCATVCPKGLNPAAAIRKLRDKMLAESV